MDKVIIIDNKFFISVIYIVRIICIAIIIYVLTVISVNPIGLSIILLLCLVSFFLTVISKIIFYEDHLCLRDKRMLPLLSRSLKIYYDEIDAIECNKMEISIIMLLLPGSEWMKDAEMVFHLKDGREIKKNVFDRSKKI